MTFDNNLKTWICQQTVVAWLYCILALIAYKSQYNCIKLSEQLYDFILPRELDHSGFK